MNLLLLNGWLVLFFNALHKQPFFQVSSEYHPRFSLQKVQEVELVLAGKIS
jgi:hypothetical protein